MGLIRSGTIPLTPQSPARELRACLWPIVREMIKTAIENGQDLIVEGCYIPHDFRRELAPQYLACIRPLWLIFSRRYIERHFDDIVQYASAAERRMAGDGPDRAALAEECRRDLEACIRCRLPYVLFDEAYELDIDTLWQ